MARTYMSIFVEGRLLRLFETKLTAQQLSDFVLSQRWLVQPIVDVEVRSERDRKSSSS